MIRKDSWSHWEDETITEVVLDYAKQKKTIGQAFSYLSNIIPNRTASAITYQWYTNIRPKVFKTEEEEATSDHNESAILSLAEYIELLKSTNLTQETIELINLRIRSLI